MEDKVKVLFLCTGNSCRSQMAEGILRHLDGARFEVYSAGVEPDPLNQNAVEVMKEINIDISKQRSKNIAIFSGKSFDYIITLCDHANEVCPIFPGNVQRIHWSIEDPAKFRGSIRNTLMVYRKTRDKIKRRLLEFVKSKR